MITYRNALLESSLRESGYSLTTPRTRVFEYLQRSQEPLTMRELIEGVETEVERTSVYRTIDLYEKLGIVQRLPIGWKYKIELSEQFSHHHHHVTCMLCETVITFEESKLIETEIQKLAEAMGFEVDGHTLELRGKCRNCRGL